MNSCISNFLEPIQKHALSSSVHLETVYLKALLYCRQAIIRRCLQIFNLIFHFSLQSSTVNIADNLCTKQINSSKQSMGYDQEPVISGYNDAFTISKFYVNCGEDRCGKTIMLVV